MRKIFTSGIIVFLGALFVAAPFALAAPAPTPASDTPSGQGLEISPPVVEVSANPGETVTLNIRLRNVTKGALITKGRADDFGAGTSEDGQPKLLLDETGATRYSLKYWVQGVPDLLLAPQELKTNIIKIVVPKNAEPGGHFGVIRFTALPPKLEGTGVALSASIGTLVLLRVNGVVTEKVSLAEFSTTSTTQRKGKAPVTKAGSFFEHGPIDFLVRARNEGNVHEKLTGSIAVKSMMGNKVGSVVVNDKGGNVLPDSVRRFEQTLDQKQLFGYYTATLALSYSNGQKLNGNLGFWVIPWKLILLILIGLVILFFGLRLALRKYNDHIIKMARR